MSLPVFAPYAPVNDRSPYNLRRCIREIVLCLAVLALSMLCANSVLGIAAKKIAKSHVAPTTQPALK